MTAAHDVPGVSMAVLVDGQVVEAAAGVVNLRTRVPVTPDSVFMIQSITKVWTATLVMQLVDDGLCELDTPVREYLPEFRTADERASAEITIRHLLTHTGGFEGDIWAATTDGEDALERFVGDLVANAPQRTRPGTMYSYCSAGYGVLGRLVEVQREMSYSTAVRRYLAEPLGIDEIAFCANEALGFRTAIGHARPRPDAPQRPLQVWAVMPPSNPAAGNQLAMSARALIAFAGMHLADGATRNGDRPLSAKSARAMRVRQVDHPAAIGAPSGHGLGWFLSDRPGVVEHGGDMIGVAAMLRIVPEEGIAVAVLTNGGAAGPLMRDVIDPLLHDLAGVGRRPTVPSPPATSRTSNPDRYVGRYETRPALNEVTLDDDGRLWLTVADRREALTLAERAGSSAESIRSELRQVDGDLFVRTDAAGTGMGLVEFLDTDDSGRARFLHTGRAQQRTD
ncbi:serine hydrolase domain-containing protein [Solicola gregarius]|uniref:Beta-lactamase family protein n=1 Tax=Solicola gregarius TaxID=2908642 RepID=A0AA46TK65_9ACTN|nr:serine hydrolase domain-containing protein [Solicola gregarius]UYM06834.1 beta-lactamase family protein [Solicola gregarius]